MRDGERRRVDRRIGKSDSRVFRYERRVGERRTPRDQIRPIDDDMIIEVTIEGDPRPAALTVDLPAALPMLVDAPDGSGEVDFDDLTAIRELVHDLRPSELAG